MKVVFALRKEGITPSSTLSNTYFKAKKVGLVLVWFEDISGVKNSENYEAVTLC